MGLGKDRIQKKKIPDNVILVADDQMMNIEVHKIVLEQINCLEQAEFYYNGEEVFKRIKTVHD